MSRISLRLSEAKIENLMKMAKEFNKEFWRSVEVHK